MLTGKDAPARSSKQQLDPQSPGQAPEPQGSRKGKKVTTLSRMGFRIFFYILRFGRTPTGGKTQTMGFLGHFGLGRPSARVEIPGPCRKRKKTQFPGARGTFWGGIRTPQKFLPESAQLCYISRFGRLDPHGREVAEYGGFTPFWHRTARGTERNSGRETEKCRASRFGLPHMALQCPIRTGSDSTECTQYALYDTRFPVAGIGSVTLLCACHYGLHGGEASSFLPEGPPLGGYDAILG